MIAIIDYGMGNIRSVEKGFLKIGADVRITADPKIIADADGLVLPVRFSGVRLASMQIVW